MMEPYLDKALQQFENVIPTNRQDWPYPHIEAKYGTKQQNAESEYDESPPASKEEQKYMQKVNSKFLWYGHSVDAILSIYQHTKSTTETMKRLNNSLLIQQHIRAC